jgi:F-type H+-transporting ATPase subunit a
MTINCLAAGLNPLEHVIDHAWLKSPGGELTLLSNHLIMMATAALLLIVLLPRLVRLPDQADPVDRLTPRGIRHAIEVICEFLRDFVAKPNFGPYTDRFIPFIWSTFFFILTCNLLGLLPLEPITRPIMEQLGFHHGIYGTPTGNIWVTGTLAACTLLMIVVNGLRLHGITYVKHFFMGPFPISLLIAVLEVIGLFAKSFALAIRLFANMVAGHILLAVLILFVGMAMGASLMTGVLISIPVVLGSVAIMLLELFVALLQAFIFTFLSCVFIGQAVNLHSDHEEAHMEMPEVPEMETAAH